MQLGHLQAVLLAEQLAGDQRRARVVAQLAVTVEVFDHRNIGLKLCRQVVLLPDPGDAFEILAGTLGVLAAQLISRACVGVQVRNGFSFFSAIR